MNKEVTSLKAKIRNIAKEKDISAQVILQNYMFERFLERLSHSSYKNNFIIKGGLLIAALVGIDNRATKDILYEETVIALRSLMDLKHF